ncbi:uncharacterized protein LOC115629406 [Scaptodrosophila lebanonensis]|uniref:Uncharacterized protein LOC115629406 n=1 Tax=Drosophila lebanonensis TaxID=7225 RepID=A0A6J2U3M0_DROLE|nr:uncharacterized protein LOC115629406 [Scaptodrosophila lebanonensis]
MFSDTQRVESTSVRASIQVSAVNSNKLYWLNNVQTIPNLGLPKQTVNVDELRGEYNHLKDIPLQSYYNIQPMLLIGTNNWKIAVPRMTREGKWNEPIASKCFLGWSTQGSTTSQRFVSMHHCDCKWQELHDEVKESFNLDNILPRNLQSKDDKRPNMPKEEWTI